MFSVWQKLNFRLLFVRIKNKFLPHGKHVSNTTKLRLSWNFYTTLDFLDTFYRLEDGVLRDSDR